MTIYSMGKTAQDYAWSDEVDNTGGEGENGL
jgi:hypothetical protein